MGAGCGLPPLALAFGLLGQVAEQVQGGTEFRGRALHRVPEAGIVAQDGIVADQVGAHADERHQLGDVRPVLVRIAKFEVVGIEEGALMRAPNGQWLRKPDQRRRPP